MNAGQDCFLDKARPCDSNCKAHDPKTKECRILRASSSVTSLATILSRWLGSHEPPRV